MAFIFTKELLEESQYYIANGFLDEQNKAVTNTNADTKSPMCIVLRWIRGSNPNIDLKTENLWDTFNQKVSSATYNSDTNYLYRGTDYAPYLHPKVAAIIDYSNWITSWSTKETVAIVL